MREIERCAKAGHKGVLFTGAPQGHGMPALTSPAPGMTPVGAALSDRSTPSASARPLAASLSGPGPCYALRAEGPLMESIRNRELEQS